MAFYLIVFSVSYSSPMDETTFLLPKNPSSLLSLKLFLLSVPPLTRPLHLAILPPPSLLPDSYENEPMDMSIEEHNREDTMEMIFG